MSELVQVRTYATNSVAALFRNSPVHCVFFFVSKIANLPNGLLVKKGLQKRKFRNLGEKLGGKWEKLEIC